MSRSPRRLVVSTLLLAGALSGAGVISAQTPAAPPPNAMQAALVADVTNLSDKFTGLARVMAGKYDWRPSPNVRSVVDVFNLIVNENNMLAGLLTGAAPAARGAGAAPAPVTDPAAMQEALRTSYASLGKALAGLSATDLNANVTLFGRSMTKQGAAMFLLMDQHEHLGQSIAYARSNGVVPPWSK
jgi:hypothetical protein